MPGADRVASGVGSNPANPAEEVALRRVECAESSHRGEPRFLKHIVSQIAQATAPPAHIRRESLKVRVEPQTPRVGIAGQHRVADGPLAPGVAVLHPPPYKPEARTRILSALERNPLLEIRGQRSEDRGQQTERQKTRRARARTRARNNRESLRNTLSLRFPLPRARVRARARARLSCLSVSCLSVLCPLSPDSCSLSPVSCRL